MSKFAFAIVAAALIGAGNAITQALKAAPDDNDPNTGSDTTAAAEPKGKPGRKPAEKAAETPKETPKEVASGGKTYEELRALIQPLVEGGQGEDVKKTIGKYAPGGGGLKELATLPQHHAAFEKDISALGY